MPQTFPQLLDKLEVDKGDVLYLHTSYSRVANLGLSPEELTKTILDRIGPNGTLVMPSFAWNLDKTERPWAGFDLYFKQKPPLDIRYTPSNIGVVPESFRSMNGVLRSESFWWPVCAKGPLAEQVTKDQWQLDHSFGPGSTFNLLHRNGVKILGLGVTLNTTSLALLPNYEVESQHYQKVFTKDLMEGIVIDKEGIERRTQSHWLLAKVVRYIKPGALFDYSEDLRKKTNMITEDGIIFFCYPYDAYHQAALTLAKPTLNNGKKLPWLEQYDE